LAPAPACARSAGRLHPLVALWPVAVREELRSMLSTPTPRDARRFAAGIGMREVEFAAEAGDPFMNVNTEADLAAARAVAGDPYS
ncbi:MAG: molybdenum cofactor guanylyltransferase, partial [Acetobacteraceae bacterium]